MDREKALELALGQIEKQFGKGTLMKLGADQQVKVAAIPTGALSLDLALGIGGLPRGRVVEIYGPESSGKSSLALHVIAEAQKLGGIAAFIDAEHALDPVYARAIGVDIDELLVAQPDTGEQALEIADMLVRSGAVDVIVIDSVAALVPRVEIEGEMGDSHVGLQARLMSQALRKLTGNLNRSKTCCVFINQLREKVGVMFGSPETTPGGRALKFYSSVRLDVRRIESLKDGQDFVGNRVRAKVVKNKCLAAGTAVFDPTTGLTHPIEDIVERGQGSAVWAADKAGKLHIRPIRARLDQGPQQVIGLGLADGTTLRVTPDHRILSEHGWKEAGHLRAGDRIARPRRAGGFGDAEPVAVQHARLLGHLLAAGPSPDRAIPPAFFAPDVSEAVIGNLLFGLWETDGWISRRTAGTSCGFTTTSEQLAWQIHWLLLRWEITSSVADHQGGERRRPTDGRRATHEGRCWRVRVSGIDDVRRLSRALPMWGPRGQELTNELGDPALAEKRRPEAEFLPVSQTQPVIGHLRRSGLTARSAACVIGLAEHQARGGWKSILGRTRLRRDRVAALAAALDDPFLREVLDEDLFYDRIVAISDPERADTYDLEIDEHHTLVAADVVVHNCAAPFRQAEFDIMFGEGISREGSILDVGVETAIVKKAGAWYQYDGEQLGQGRENARQFLKENDDIAREIEKKAKEALGITVRASDADPAGEPEDHAAESVDR